MGDDGTLSLNGATPADVNTYALTLTAQVDGLTIVDNILFDIQCPILSWTINSEPQSQNYLMGTGPI